MQRLRSWVTRLWTRQPPAPMKPNTPRVDFSYTVYWTKHARQWDAQRRAAVNATLQPILQQAQFEANAYERRYTVPGLDDQAHSGASLVALHKVLAALDSATTE